MSENETIDADFTFVVGEVKNKPYVMCDLRIYELARAPELMNPEEKAHIESNPDVKARYNRFRRMIEASGF